MAGRDGTSESDKDYKMVPTTDGKGKPVLDGNGKPVMTKKYLTKAEKGAASAPAPKPKPKPKAASKPKKDIAAMAGAAIERGAPTRPQARPTPTRPKAAPRTATKVETPEVTTSVLPKAGSGGTSNGVTWKQYQEGNNLGRLRNGFEMGLSKSEFDALASNGILMPKSARKGDAPTPNGSTAARKARRTARGYAKGGLVKANCGASMKPTQKGTRKK